MSANANPAPVQKLSHPLFTQHQVEVSIKREDLLHAQVSGNKWRKLKYNLAFAGENGFKQLLTFGGAYSNHLYATAAAGKLYGFETIGVVRGEPTFPLNPTLDFAVANGMQLHYINREEYRNKNSNDLMFRLHEQYGAAFFIPEGGSNAWGVNGCMDILRDVKEPFDLITVACGTGATLAGILLSLNKKQRAIGFSAFKGGDFLYDEVKLHAQNVLQDAFPNHELDKAFEIDTEFHFGGYGKINAELISFMQEFHSHFNIKLDPVYTAKMAFGVFEKIKRGDFKPGTRILMIHTGGLQGLAGFEERLGINIYPGN
jgi:1-aminocyclopropane-1-carboxylate deaminase/D-cysteine desulfhydrase-like pyridoxal-dependent ACC family enzyme